MLSLAVKSLRVGLDKHISFFGTFIVSTYFSLAACLHFVGPGYLGHAYFEATPSYSNATCTPRPQGLKIQQQDSEI